MWHLLYFYVTYIFYITCTDKNLRKTSVRQTFYACVPHRYQYLFWCQVMLAALQRIIILYYNVKEIENSHTSATGENTKNRLLNECLRNIIHNNIYVNRMIKIIRFFFFYFYSGGHQQRWIPLQVFGIFPAIVWGWIRILRSRRQRWCNNGSGL